MLSRLVMTISLTCAILLPVSVFAAWQMNLEVKIPDQAADNGVASNQLIFGSDSLTSDDFDNLWDVVAYTGGALNAFFSHTEYPVAKNKLWQDLRRVKFPQTWAVEVSSQLQGHTTLAWDRSDIPTGVTLQLTDEQTGQAVDMKAANEYTYSNDPVVSRKFVIQATDNTSSGSSSSAGTGGGGCGYVKNIGKDNGAGGSPGSAAVNTLILLVPLLWLAARKVALFRSIAHGDIHLRERLLWMKGYGSAGLLSILGLPYFWG